MSSSSSSSSSLTIPYEGESNINETKHKHILEYLETKNVTETLNRFNNKNNVVNEIYDRLEFYQVIYVNLGSKYQVNLHYNDDGKITYLEYGFISKIPQRNP